MNGHGDRIAAREKVVRCVLAVITAERSIADDPKGVIALMKAEVELEFACRDLARFIDDLLPVEQPKGWHE